MSKTSNNQVTAALTIKVPQRIGWSVQRGDQSWTGGNLTALTECLQQQANDKPVTFSLSLIFELTENEGSVRSPSGIADLEK